MAKKSFDKNKILKNIGTSIPSSSTVFEDPESNEKAVTMPLRNVKKILIANIEPDPNQPRMVFDDESIKDLAESIIKHGLLQPITVIEKEKDKYTILTGERRFRAVKKNGSEYIDCVVLKVENEKDKQAKQIIENLVREDLTPIERAYAIQEYKKFLGEEISWKEVEKELNISETRRKQFLALTRLPEDIRQRISNEKRENKLKITERHARALLKIKDEEKQNDLIDKIVQENLTSDEAMKRAVELADEAKKADVIALGQNAVKVYKIKENISYRTDKELLKELQKHIERIKEAMKLIKNAEGVTAVPPEDNLAD